MDPYKQQPCPFGGEVFRRVALLGPWKGPCRSFPVVLSLKSSMFCSSFFHIHCLNCRHQYGQLTYFHKATVLAGICHKDSNLLISSTVLLQKAAEILLLRERALFDVLWTCGFDKTCYLWLCCDSLPCTSPASLPLSFPPPTHTVTWNKSFLQRNHKSVKLKYSYGTPLQISWLQWSEGIKLLLNLWTLIVSSTSILKVASHRGAWSWEKFGYGELGLSNLFSLCSVCLRPLTSWPSTVCFMCT